MPLKGGTNNFLKGGTNHPLKGGTNHLLKGGNRPAKGGTNHLEKGDSPTIIRETCNSKIGELEADFSLLTDFSKTNWNKFIASGWSVMLAKERPQELSRRYSAQQCALNLLSLLEERAADFPSN